MNANVGDPAWGHLPWNHPSAPHGGEFGRVEWFANEAARRGLFTVWSPYAKRFGIFSMVHGAPQWQMMFETGMGGSPIPMTEELLWLMCHLREKHCRTTANTIRGQIEAMRLDRKAAEEKAQMEWAKEAYEQVYHDLRRKAGRGRATIVVPTGRRMPAQAAAYMRRRRTRGMVG